MARAKAREAATTPVQRHSCEVFLNELVWRDFPLQVLHNFLPSLALYQSVKRGPAAGSPDTPDNIR